MNLPIGREFFAQIFIILGICVGGWMVLVEPSKARLHELEQIIAEHHAQSAALNHSIVEKIAVQAPVLRALCREVESRSRLAQDSSGLYGLVMDLAKAHQLQVQNLSPRLDSGGTAARTVHRARTDVTMEGEYEQLAGFLQALDELDAYIRPTSLSLSPTGREGRPRVAVQLGFEAFGFDLPPVLSKMTGGHDRDP